jgi:hypothetical protein
MIVNWDFYVRRKRINVKAWIERKNIKDYNGLVEVTKKLGIETPPEEKVSKYFEKPKVKKNDKKIKKPAPELDTVPSKVSKKIETSTDSRVQEALSSQKPKQTRKRKPRKKRQPIKKEDK